MTTTEEPHGGEKLCNGRDPFNFFCGGTAEQRIGRLTLSGQAQYSGPSHTMFGKRCAVPLTTTTKRR